MLLQLIGIAFSHVFNIPLRFIFIKLLSKHLFALAHLHSQCLIVFFIAPIFIQRIIHLHIAIINIGDVGFIGKIHIIKSMFFVCQHSCQLLHTSADFFFFGCQILLLGIVFFFGNLFIQTGIGFSQSSWRHKIKQLIIAYHFVCYAAFIFCQLFIRQFRQLVIQHLYAGLYHFFRLLRNFVPLIIANYFHIAQRFNFYHIQQSVVLVGIKAAQPSLFLFSCLFYRRLLFLIFINNNA